MINAVLTFVLICVTGWYTILTRRSVKAAERSVMLNEAERLERRDLEIRRFRADVEKLRDQLLTLPGVGPREWEYEHAMPLVRTADLPSEAELETLREIAILLGPDELQAAMQIRTNCTAILRIVAEYRKEMKALVGVQGVYPTVNVSDWNWRYRNVEEGIKQALAAADTAQARIKAHPLRARLNAGD